MKFIHSTVYLLLFFATVAFARAGSYSVSPGTYGTEQVKLHLNSDQSFVYIHSGSDLSVSGTWVQEDHKIMLSADSKDNYPKVWKLESEYPCVKARQGMEFLRLCLND